MKKEKKGAPVYGAEQSHGAANLAGDVIDLLFAKKPGDLFTFGSDERGHVYVLVITKAEYDQG